jgi:hypothetical protein
LPVLCRSTILIGAAKKHDGNRGRGATGKIPFIAAVATSDEGHPLNMRFTRIRSFSLKAVEAWAAHHLAPGSHVISDGLGCFNAIGRAGDDHTAIITGSDPDSVQIPEFKWISTIIGNVKNSLRGTFHAISEKHFPGIWQNFAIGSTGALICVS